MNKLLNKLCLNLSKIINVPADRELNLILNNIQDVYYRVDTEGIILRLSKSVQELLGYQAEEIIGTHMANYYAESNGREKFLQHLAEAGGSITNYDIQLRHKNGQEVWISTNSHYFHDKQGTVIGVEGVARNITELKSHIQQLSKLSNILEHTADMVMVTNTDGVIEYVNHAFEDVTGYSSDEVIGRTPSLLKSDKHDEAIFTDMWETINAGNTYRNIIINRSKDGRLFYEEKVISPLKDEQGRIIHFISTSNDVTARIETDKRLHHMAHHDALTGLPNRQVFIDRFDAAIQQARKHSRLVAIMFIDLDNFKNINDTLGHDIGDELLIQFTRRLKNTLREEDTVSRFGGDEFIILLEDITNLNHISLLARKVLEILNEPFVINGNELFITASIGISNYPDDGTTTSTLLRTADLAMYRAKEQGKNSFQYYAREMGTKLIERMKLESHLRTALERREFVVYYQPQMDIQSRRIIGVEALLRWQHPDMGLITPLHFISLLEETGHIEAVGNWVLETACRQARQWHEQGWEKLDMAINLSSRQFNKQHCINAIQETIEETGVNPHSLELEITESMLMRNTSSTINALQKLSELGIRFAIDDFGTGYSSLSYLRRFPIDTIKIDRSFIHDINTDPDDIAITSAIIVMAKSLSLNVIAEGVETEEQFEFLRQHECDYAQGYLISRPVPAEQMTRLLAKQPAH